MYYLIGSTAKDDNHFAYTPWETFTSYDAAKSAARRYRQSLPRIGTKLSSIDNALANGGVIASTEDDELRLYIHPIDDQVFYLKCTRAAARRN